MGVTAPGCVLKGTSPVAKSTQLFNAAAGGRVIASFTGNYAPMALSEIPADPANARAKLVTSTGAPSLRLEGYVKTTAVPVFTARDIPVVAGTVWISNAHKVQLVGAAPSSLAVELTVAGTRNQTVRGSTTCDALALQRGTPTPMDVPGNARGYLTRASSIDIHGQPGGDVRFTLQMIEGSSQLFWSTEAREGFVHVQLRADLTIDGWIRSRDLDPLKKGEMMDQYIPPQTQVVGAQLAIDKPPRLAKAATEIAVRARRDEKEKPIGAVEPGAEIYVMETVAGWTNVLPKSLYVVPPDDGGFWIPASETPI
jgi:hypothetical protein